MLSRRRGIAGERDENGEPDPFSRRIDGLRPQMKKRPRDPNQLAKSIIGIATGQIEDREPTPEEQGKDPAAFAMGRKGGAARAEKLSESRRKEIAKAAAASRWKRD